MNITGRVLKASIVRGRDATEMLLRLEIRDGDFDALKATSEYVNQFGSVDLVEVPADYWDPKDEADPLPAVPLLPDEEPSPRDDDEAPMGDSALND